MSVGVQALTETTGKAVLARFASLYTGTIPTAPGFIAFTASHRPLHSLTIRVNSKTHYSMSYHYHGDIVQVGP